MTPLLLGLDGRKMGKSRGNSIALAAERRTRPRASSGAARTDAERRITYEPDRRPEVANLLEIASLCLGLPARRRSRTRSATRAPAALKRLVAWTRSTSASGRSAARRAELATQPDYLRRVLRAR